MRCTQAPSCPPRVRSEAATLEGGTLSLLFGLELRSVSAYQISRLTRAESIVANSISKLRVELGEDAGQVVHLLRAVAEQVEAALVGQQFQPSRAGV